MPYKVLHMMVGFDDEEIEVYVIVDEKVEYINVMSGDVDPKCTCDTEADANEILGLLNGRLH